MYELHCGKGNEVVKSAARTLADARGIRTPRIRMRLTYPPIYKGEITKNTCKMLLLISTIIMDRTNKGGCVS